ncbi:MAG: hypothetical protein JWO13_1994 [Acidobacteriales bacterium]|nr:hypothetical protein [Terriglobales bacterium]
MPDQFLVFNFGSNYDYIHGLALQKIKNSETLNASHSWNPLAISPSASFDGAWFERETTEIMAGYTTGNPTIILSTHLARRDVRAPSMVPG